MRAIIAGRVFLTLFVTLALATGCGRKYRDQGGSFTSSDSVLSETPPPQPTGPQIADSDSMMSRLAPQLADWAAMWRAAVPGFEIDSLFIADVRPAIRNGDIQDLDKVYPPAPDKVDVFRVLSEDSPDGRYRLVFDWYQSIGVREGRVQVGGGPDSAPLLLDFKRATSNRFTFCGTPCGFHWGAWLTKDRFALGGWQQADTLGHWMQGSLQVYSLLEASCTTYVTRIIPANDYARYRAAWEQWVAARYRATGSRRRT